MTPEWQLLNRVYIGQVDGIDTRRGTMNVLILDDLKSRREALEIPLLGFSINGARDGQNRLRNAFRSSWIRYMPQVGDFVYVAFGAQNQARVLGPATLPGGYAAVMKDRDANLNKYPRELVDLREGEWDWRSAGGAYVHGSRDGTLLLAAGPTVQVRFNKQENEARAESGLWVVGSTGSYVRLGDVKRLLLPTDFVETDVSGQDPLATKEHRVHVETPPTLPGQPATLLYDEWNGTVRDSAGVPQTLVGALRSRRRIYVLGATSTAPTSAYTEEVDVLGNKRTEHAATTTIIETSAPAAANSESYLSHEVTASTTATMHGGAQASLTSDALVQLEAVLVQLGQNATEASVHGTTFLIHYGVLFGAVATFAGAVAANPTPVGIAAAASALSTALTAVAAQLAIPPGPGGMLSSKVLVE